ncbi:MAG: hypothetical protein HS116_03745 [Planctomycetes bacterium]|nr:hypothetical protein [Planctomycetota bacterium]
MKKTIDYAKSGLDIQAAMVDLARQFPNKERRPKYLLWNGIKVKTSDQIRVPQEGVVTATFISANPKVTQGFDLKAVDGWLGLKAGEKIPILRTWFDERYEDKVSYPFFSSEGSLKFWNVYKRNWPNGSVGEEKWTGNAGFWVEELGKWRRIYHCSHGLAPSPDFESLVIKIEICSDGQEAR